MKQEIRNKKLLGAIVFLGLITILFAILSLFNIDNFLIRIIYQASLFLIAFLNGIRSIVYEKQKKLGYVLIGASIFQLLAILKQFPFFKSIYF